MISFETALAFCGTCALLGLAPGPDNIFVLTQSALRGSRIGITVVLGLSSGLIVHTLAVAFGLAAVFKTSAAAFTGLKLAGAAYLAYLAVQAFRNAGKTTESAASGPVRGRTLYWRGVLMNITNPKVSLFFLAFLPQFANPAKGSLTVQLLLFGALAIMTSLVVFIGIALLAGRLSAVFQRSSRVQMVMNRVAGTVFLGLALKLVTARR